MDRPSRNKKTVNYSEFKDANDDEDFASVTVPPSKKARVSVRDGEQEGKIAKKSKSQEPGCQLVNHKARLSMDDKLYEQHLEAALQLSLMQTAEMVQELPSQDTYDKTPVPTEQEETVCPALLSNCSVDASLLGLDEISEEAVPDTTPSRQRQAASKAAEQQRKLLKQEKASSADSEGDEDYKPACTPETDSENDEDYSGNEESEDEEFTVKKNKNSKKKLSKKQAGSRPLSSGKGKNTPNPTSKAQGKKANSATTKEGTSSACRTAAPVRPASVKKRIPPASTPKTAVPVSPAGGRPNKWNPPGLVRRSPSVTQNAPVKSPSQGLRLGLSRLATVKPLHPRVAH